MNRGLQLEVTDEDLLHGTRHDPRGCAIALAARRKFKAPALAFPAEGLGCISTSRGCYLGDAGLYRFMLDFDNGRPLEPCIFTLTEETEARQYALARVHYVARCWRVPGVLD